MSTAVASSLNGQFESDAPTDPVLPSSRVHGIPKEDRYRWVRQDKKGAFHWVSKSLLKVDARYQRTEGVSMSEVMHIARFWTWVACGALIVARRPDGTLWVIDGQHRLLAALRRSDVMDLPCIVFEHIEIDGESGTYLIVNSRRRAMRGVDRFKAQVESGDETAIAVKDMVESSGYHFTRSAHDNFSVACVQTVLTCYQQSSGVCRDIWKLCVDVHQGQSIIDHVFSGLFHLEYTLSRRDEGSLLDRHNYDALMAKSVSEIKTATQKASAFYSKGGAKVWAEGIVNMLNHKRSSRRIRSMFADAKDDE